MTLLAPWAMAIGVLGAAGTVLLHLIARGRPTSWVLPTARFIPDRQSVVNRIASRPRDLLLLACRVLLLLCAGAAFAQPVFAPGRTGRARIVLLDRSAVVADPADAWRRARSHVAGVTASTVIPFDTAAVVVPAVDVDSAAPMRSASSNPGSLSAALIAARRASAALAQRADSIELVLVSPVAQGEIDSATRAVRALWPGAIAVERTALRTDSAGEPSLERAMPMSDLLGPALARMSVIRSARSVRVQRGATATRDDSAFARAGGTVVVWDSSAAPLEARGLALGDDVIVAHLGRRGQLHGLATRARWADGSPAAIDDAIGAGCIRTVDIHAPSAGDLALRPGFQRIVRGLVDRCPPLRAAAADSATIEMLRGGNRAAPSSAFGGETQASYPLVPWLLGAALLLALLELVLRRWPASPEVPA